MKFPIGIQNFEKLREDSFIYIDKTKLVHRLVVNGGDYFLSRPRRFGKSLLISTLEAYFSGNKEVFQGLAIESLEKDWIQYPILHIDLNTERYNSVEALANKLETNLYEWEQLYGKSPVANSFGTRFEYVIRKAFEKTGRRVVILVDEYDKPMLQAIGNNDLQREFRNILKGFYGALKSCDHYIRFAFLTGVTKFGKVSVFSDLNNLQDLSMDKEYQSICGITEEEIHQYFAEPVQQLAEEEGLTVEQTLQKLKQLYDGYHFVAGGVGIYNPFSLLNTLKRKQFGSYWFETGTPTYLVELLQRKDYVLPNLTEEVATADMLNSIDSFSDNPIPVIYQSGYLTIKGYDKEFEEYHLGFPNKEVEEGFTRFLLPFYTNAEHGKMPFSIASFVRDLRSGRPAQFMQRMESMFADTDYRVVGDSELYFQNAFYLLAKMMGFYTKVERATSDGRMDMTIEAANNVYIFEFKLDGSAEAALKQIDEKGYATPFISKGCNIYKVGVNFSLKKRCIDGWKIAE